MRYNPKIVVAYFKECGLPEPELEFKFHKDRKWRFDFAWLREQVVIEIQGGIFIRGGHNRGADMLKEWEKLNEAACLGWRILYCQPKDICTVEIVNLLKRALGI